MDDAPRPEPARGAAPSPGFLSGGGETGERLRAFDWSAHPLGAPEAWPAPLKTLVGLMLNAKQAMFAAWGPERRMLYNDAYAPICGRRHPAALGARFYDVWHDIVDDVGPILERAFAGEPTHMDDIGFVLHRNGFPEEAHFSFSYTPVRDEHGVVAGMFCACTEITQQVLAERRNVELLAASRNRAAELQRWFDHAPGFFAMLRGPEHVFEMVNPAFLRLVGRRRLIGRPLLDAMPELRGQGFDALLERVRATGTPFVGRDVPVTLQREAGADGEQVRVDFVYEPVFDGAGRVTGVFVQGHDVTERHRAMQALREADRRKDEFLATLAHELRGPLAPLTNSLRLVERGEPLSGRGRDALRMATRQTVQLRRLVDDLLDVGRITRGTIVLRPERLDAVAVLRQAAEAIRPDCAARRQALLVDAPPAPAWFDADPVRTAQMLGNLLRNACKFTPEGGTLRLGATDLGDRVEFRVTDDGIGIEPDAIERIFELFHQHEPDAGHVHGGLGIGLALVRRLAALHGGSVHATSEGRGRGATFVLSLPRGRPAG
jgi:PAS domain S-box-containing protein